MTKFYFLQTHKAFEKAAKESCKPAQMMTAYLPRHLIVKTTVKSPIWPSRRNAALVVRFMQFYSHENFRPRQFYVLKNNVSTLLTCKSFRED